MNDARLKQIEELVNNSAALRDSQAVQDLLISVRFLKRELAREQEMAKQGRGECDDLRGRWTKAQMERDEAKAAAQRLITDLHCEVAKKDKDIACLRSNLSGVNEALRKAQEESVSFSGLHRHQAQISESLARESAECKSRILDLEQKNKKLHDQVTGLLADLDTRGDQINKLQSRLDFVANRVLESGRSENDTLNANNRLNDEVATLRKNLEDANKRAYSHAAKLDEAERKGRDHTKEVAALSAKIVELEDQLESNRITHALQGQSMMEEKDSEYVALRESRDRSIEWFEWWSSRFNKLCNWAREKLSSDLQSEFFGLVANGVRSPLMWVGAENDSPVCVKCGGADPGARDQEIQSLKAERDAAVKSANRWKDDVDRIAAINKEIAFTSVPHSAWEAAEQKAKQRETTIHILASTIQGLREELAAADRWEDVANARIKELGGKFTKLWRGCESLANNWRSGFQHDHFVACGNELNAMVLREVGPVVFVDEPAHKAESK